MRCPHCHVEFDVPADLTETGCPDCLWVPIDMVKGILRAIQSGEEAAPREVAAHVGQGMVVQLAELGFLDPDEMSKWIERLLDAAGLDHHTVVEYSSLEVQLEVEEEDNDSSD